MRNYLLPSYVSIMSNMVKLKKKDRIHIAAWQLIYYLDNYLGELTTIDKERVYLVTSPVPPPLELSGNIFFQIFFVELQKK